MKQQERLSGIQQFLDIFNFLPCRKKQLTVDDNNAGAGKKIIELPNIGCIHMCKHKSAKNLKISLRPYRPVRLTVPYKTSFKDAERFLHSKRGWLKKNVEKIKELENKNRLTDEEIEILRFKAKSYLPFRVQELAEQYDFKYNRVFIKNLKTRWGSCSYKNNINLNLHLMRLPDKLVDYVILHELAHTKEKNHGKGFYSLMDMLVSDVSTLECELKKHIIF